MKEGGENNIPYRITPGEVEYLIEKL